MDNNISVIMEKLIIWVIIIGLVALIFVAIIVHDYQYIIDHPVYFIIELIFSSVIPTLLIIVIFVRTRNLFIKDSITWFIFLSMKFAVFHLLFQLAGIYSVVFDGYPRVTT